MGAAQSGGAGRRAGGRPLHASPRAGARLRPLTIETLGALIAAGRPLDALALIDRLTTKDRWHGRVRLLESRAALDAGDLGRAGRVLDTGLVVDDLREGEDALDELWWDYHERIHPSGAARARREPAAVRLRLQRQAVLNRRVHQR
ncbi:hypothetical protein [Nonomuraea sp. NPDC048916]|uniref:hypothetical protein n=1 Tax=Nonomuraea sp. NPDC048916 TaxID=3154232 RepID=UPI003410B193